MTVRCSAVFAPDALPALADAVRVAKDGAQLAHVTVIVPTNAVGVTARRWLGAHGGVAALELVTPGRLAERIAGAELAAAGRRPVSTPLIDLTVREVVRHAPGDYGPVVEHPSTVTSLRDLHRELRLAGPAATDALRNGSRRASEAARISSMVAERLAADWYDEADLLALAVERIRGGVELFDRAVAFLPRVDRGLPAELLRTVGERCELHVIAEWAGAETVDAETSAFCSALGATVDAPGRSVPDPPTAALVLSTTDADEEVRHSVRRVVDAARAGIPFARMAIVWPTDRPYARLVEHHLDHAGIPWNGRPGTLVTERLIPRFLLDLLDLDRRGLRRTELFDFLADVPVHTADGRRVSVARWERVARAAGISREEHWQPRLARLAAAARAKDPPRDRDADDADRLARFVDDLRRDLGARRRTRPWAEWADWCEHQVLQRLGAAVLEQLDEAERLASDHASRVLDRLRHLDAISRPVDRGEFRAAFAAEFEGAPGRLGRLGDGVTIGSLAGTGGLDADLTIVLGAADGLLPPPPPTDPLVSDADRRAAGLVTADDRSHRIHRSFLSHVRTSRELVVHAPRGDLRATTERLPSRWIAAHLAGVGIHTVSSHRSGLLAAEFPSAATEHRLRRRAAAAIAGVAALERSVVGDVVAERALELRAARRSDRVTVYDGDLTSVEIDHLARPMSPSQIESWPACPHAYFVRHLLGVYPLDDPGEELSLSPIERGNVVHETLDRFNRLVLSGELPQPDEHGWSTEHRSRLGDLFDEVADEFERSGRTGRPAYWFLERRSVRADLLAWFERDGEIVATRRAQLVHSELRFGYDAPVALPLPDGRRLPVAGFVDRIDQQRDGQLVVMDHKSGSAKPYARITADDPTEHGTKFQLPVYAAGALAIRGELAGASDVRVRAEYDFFGRGGYARHGYTFDPGVWERITADLGHVVAGIESGLYPAVTEPPKWEYSIGCHYCQPDGLGVDERYAEWIVKRHDPRLAPWFPPGDDADGDGDDDA